MRLVAYMSLKLASIYKCVALCMAVYGASATGTIL